MTDDECKASTKETVGRDGYSTYEAVKQCTSTTNFISLHNWTQGEQFPVLYKRCSFHARVVRLVFDASIAAIDCQSFVVE